MLSWFLLVIVGVEMIEVSNRERELDMAICHLDSQFVRSIGQFVRSMGQFVLSTRQFSISTGQFVLSTGQFSIFTSRFVLSTGQFVLSIGQFSILTDQFVLLTDQPIALKVLMMSGKSLSMGLLITPGEEQAWAILVPCETPAASASQSWDNWYLVASAGQPVVKAEKLIPKPF